jgi:hypothetical protein
MARRTREARGVDGDEAAGAGRNSAEDWWVLDPGEVGVTVELRDLEKRIAATVAHLDK